MAQARSDDWNNFYSEFPPLPKLMSEIEAVDAANPKPKSAKETEKVAKAGDAAKDAAKKNKEKNKADAKAAKAKGK